MLRDIALLNGMLGMSPWINSDKSLHFFYEPLYALPQIAIAQKQQLIIFKVFLETTYMFVVLSVLDDFMSERVSLISDKGPEICPSR